MLPPPCFAIHSGAPPSGGTLNLNGVTHAGVRSHSRSETCLRFGKKKRGLCTRRSRRLLFFHPPRRDMRRKEKRLLQFAGLLIAALLFLPNVGLWSLYRDRVFDSSPDVVDGPGGIHAFQ
ncbi:hypothetical protein CHARACLAT_025471, partial [Characodon lateralis]|nr:hypothetical protein [Characodon lateralis]